jgi:hypothetical protein
MRETQEIIDVRQRAVVMSALLEMMRALALGYHGTPYFGRNADAVILRAAVFIGQAEGRRMNVSKLAEYCGIPRATAIRKLSAMAKQGILHKGPDGVYCVPIALANSPDVLQMSRQMRAIIARAHEQLSKMNGLLS